MRSLLCVLVVVSACGGSPSKGGPHVSPTTTDGLLAASECPEPSGPGTEHAGTISADETWTAAGSPHFVRSDLAIRGATVTVEECALVRLASGVGITVGETSGAAARLVSKGSISYDEATQTVTAVRPVVFTADDQATHWGSLRIDATGLFDAQVTALDRGGDASASAGGGGALLAWGDDNRAEIVRNVRAVLLFVSSSATLGFNVRSSAGFTADSAALFVSGCGAEGSASGNIDSRYLGYVEAPGVQTLPTGGSFTGNTIDEVLAYSPFFVTGDEAFHDVGVPYQLVYSWTQSPGAGGLSTLTIDPGVTLKVGGPRYPTPAIQLGSGPPGASLAAVRVLAAGTADKPILLTSGSPTPGAGDWVGVDWKGGPASGNVMSHVTIEHGGAPSTINGYGCGPGATDALLILSNWRPDDAFVQGCTFRSSAGGGIASGWLSDQVGPDLKSGNTFDGIANACDVSINRDASGQCPGNDAAPDCY